MLMKLTVMHPHKSGMHRGMKLAALNHRRPWPPKRLALTATSNHGSACYGPQQKDKER